MTTERRLLIVEDDEGFARTLTRSFERRGYVVRAMPSPEGLDAVAAEFMPGFAVVDLRLGHASGLACVETLHRTQKFTQRQAGLNDGTAEAVT